ANERAAPVKDELGARPPTATAICFVGRRNDVAVETALLLYIERSQALGATALGVLNSASTSPSRGCIRAPAVVPADDRIRRRARCEPAIASARGCRVITVSSGGFK